MISIKYLTSILRYNRATGEFFWRRSKGRRVSAGDRAGHDRVRGGRKYNIICIDGKAYRAHRLVWLCEKGAPPENQIDHIDGDGLNNRIDNLRDVLPIENSRNMRISKANTSGVVGVHWSKKEERWVARIKVNGRGIYIGRFRDITAAATARKEAEELYGYHANHGNKRHQYA